MKVQSEITMTKHNTIAKEFLPQSTIIPNGHEMEIQIDGIAYLYRFENKSIDEPRYGVWHFVEQEDLNVKNPRGRPRKTDVVEKTPHYECNSYTDEEIRKLEESTGLVLKDTLSIDGIVMPIFGKKEVI
jgi:hypothetical protein